MTKKQQWINMIAAMSGNLFEHYDKALFAFLAPFIAPLFFPENSPISALILTYAMIPLGLFSRPIGALFFGRIGDRKGRKQALYLTLLGMAITTTSIGFIPTFESVGWIAPLLLALCRVVQSFFAAGEVTGGALLVLESSPKKLQNFFQALYECSTMIGILCASTAVAMISNGKNVAIYWRVLYWIGGSTGFIALLVRMLTTEKIEKVQMPTPLLLLFKRYYRELTLIVITSGLSYANYYMTTSLLNGYLPLITSITKQEAMSANTLILGLDLLLLPLAGILSRKFAARKLLLFFSLFISLSALPLYTLLGSVSLLFTIAIRMVFVILGVGFSVALFPFYCSLTPEKDRYTLIALGQSVGSHLLGTSACSLSLYLYKKSGWIASPALYLAAIGTASTFLIVRLRKRTPAQVLLPT